MQAHQERVVTERNELQDKINKLGSFFSNPIFRDLSTDEQNRLTKQHKLMKEYRDVLNERIAIFG